MIESFLLLVAGLCLAVYNWLAANTSLRCAQQRIDELEAALQEAQRELEEISLLARGAAARLRRRR